MNVEQFYNHKRDCWAEVFNGMYFEAKSTQELAIKISYAYVMGFFPYTEDYTSGFPETMPILKAKFYLGLGDKHEYYQWDYKGY